MIWTNNGTTIHAHPTASGPPLIDRTKDTTILTLSRDEALGLVGEITGAFGVDGVPSAASFDKVNLIIEGGMVFPAEVEA